jgi:putative acetyltransferase
MIIRPEEQADIDAITCVTIAAFRDHPFSHQTEQFIVLALRQARALTVSLVAGIDGQVVGHIAFSPVAIADGTPDWYGLGPIAVLPAHQGRGIGKALVKEGLSRLKSIGGRGCVLVGDPAYYPRFGFRNIPGLIYEGVPPEVFMALPFGQGVPQGPVVFHEAFAAKG